MMLRKVMLLAAMLGMVLAAAAPVLARAIGGDVNVQNVDCSQVQAAAAKQSQGSASATASASSFASATASATASPGSQYAQYDQYASASETVRVAALSTASAAAGGGDGNADADSSAGDAASAADADAVAEIAQELDITQAQVNACLGGIDNDEVSSGTRIVPVTRGGGSDSGSGSPTSSASAPAELPATGGASLFALGAGALLVAGGLLARRIVR
jgi:hypothetical protein